MWVPWDGCCHRPPGLSGVVGRTSYLGDPSLTWHSGGISRRCPAFSREREAGHLWGRSSGLAGSRTDLSVARCHAFASSGVISASPRWPLVWAQRSSSKSTGVDAFAGKLSHRVVHRANDEHIDRVEDRADHQAIASHVAFSNLDDDLIATDEPEDPLRAAVPPGPLRASSGLLPPTLIDDTWARGHEELGHRSEPTRLAGVFGLEFIPYALDIRNRSIYRMCYAYTTDASPSRRLHTRGPGMVLRGASSSASRGKRRALPGRDRPTGACPRPRCARSGPRLRLGQDDRATPLRWEEGAELMARVTGHISLRDRQDGAVWYLKFRLADGRQVQRKLGPAWQEKGRPPAGYFTKRTAEEALAEILTDARRGTLADSRARSGRTFGDACVDWLRYVEHDKQRAPSTLQDYRNVVRCYLLPTFGPDTPLEKVTTEKIEQYREQLLEQDLSRRTIQKVLVLLYGILKRAKRHGWIAEQPGRGRGAGHRQAIGRLQRLGPRGGPSGRQSRSERAGRGNLHGGCFHGPEARRAPGASLAGHRFRAADGASFAAVSPTGSRGRPRAARCGRCR